jgi:hypothetical protein
MVGLPVCECAHMTGGSARAFENCQIAQRVDEGLNPIG